MKLSSIISEMYNPKMEEVKNQFKDVLGQKLGQGDNGEAYLHAKDNSKVLKFTTDMDEAEIAETIMGLGDQLKSFNRIYEVRDMDGIAVITSDYCRMANIENEEYLSFQKTVEKECKDNGIAFDELDISKDNIRRHPTTDKLVLVDF
tara:strand:+ start:520 stop:960 length:441 start_codon:yes stop_codon:yes gene_type:complete